jgi:starvation-inducible DNA-binding protein
MPATLSDQNVRQKIINFLAQTLADTYLLYVKTQNFHWNVIDERFFSLHKMFEEQYEALAAATDDLAERIRALNGKAPGSMRQFLELTSLDEDDNDLPADVMLQHLIEDHTAIAGRLRPLIPESQKYGDEGTGDLLIQRLRFHEKTAWMLRSHFVQER